MRRRVRNCEDGPVGPPCGHGSPGVLGQGMGEEGAHRSRWDQLEASARTPPPRFAGEGYDGTLQSRGVKGFSSLLPRTSKWGRRIAAACMLLLVQPASPLPHGPGSGSPGFGTELNAPSGCRRASSSPPASSRSGSPGSGSGEVVSENGGCRLVPLLQGLQPPPPLVAGRDAPRGIHRPLWDELEASSRTPPPPFAGEGIAALSPGCGVGGEPVASPVSLLLLGYSRA